MTIRSKIKPFIPPIIWDVAKTFLTPPPQANCFQKIDYQGVTTEHSMRGMHEGFFAQLYEQYRGLNPANGPEVTRLRQYMACMFAEWSKYVEGDFLTAGISYGVAPRVIYDFVDFSALGKSWHFIDPFSAANTPEGYYYNTDPELVKKQYPSKARIVIHQQYIPDVFPIENLKHLAFVHLNTGVGSVEAASLPYLYERLSPGGHILIDLYAFGGGAFATYDEVIKELGASIFSLVSGQGVIKKPVLPN